MRSVPFLLLCALLMTSAGPALAQDEEEYYVRVTQHEPETPREDREGRYDCTEKAGPNGVVETVFYDLDALSDGERWGLPYVAPTCLAADARTSGYAAPDPTCTWLRLYVDCRSSYVGAARGGVNGAGRLFDGLLVPLTGTGWGARATYNLSSGDYYLGLDLPPIVHLGKLHDLPRDLGGNTGISVDFDCRDCHPPGI